MAGSTGKIFKIIRHANCKFADVSSSLHEPERIADFARCKCLDRPDGVYVAFCEIFGALSQDSVKLSKQINQLDP